MSYEDLLRGFNPWAEHLRKHFDKKKKVRQKEKYLLPLAVPFPPQHLSPLTASVSLPPAPVASEWSEESKSSFWLTSHSTILHVNGWNSTFWQTHAKKSLICFHLGSVEPLELLLFGLPPCSFLYSFCQLGVEFFLRVRLLQKEIKSHNMRFCNLCPGQWKEDPCLVSHGCLWQEFV